MSPDRIHEMRQKMVLWFNGNTVRIAEVDELLNEVERLREALVRISRWDDDAMCKASFSADYARLALKEEP